MNTIYVTDEVDTLIAFADAWAGLGVAVQEQVKAVLNDYSADVSPNAIEIAHEMLGGYNREIDSMLSTWLEDYDKGFDV